MAPRGRAEASESAFALAETKLESAGNKTVSKLAPSRMVALLQRFERGSAAFSELVRYQYPY